MKQLLIPFDKNDANTLLSLHSALITNYTDFVIATVQKLKEVRDHPTPAKIDEVLDDLQTLVLDQE